MCTDGNAVHFIRMEKARKGLIYVRRHFDDWSPEWFFLILSGIVSLSFVFMVPPFFMPDERTHFMKIVDMSYGHIRAVKVSPRQVGAYLPVKYEHTADHYVYYISRPSVKPPAHNVKEDVLHPVTSSRPLFTPFENTAVYPPLAYLPQTLAVFITRVLGAPVLIQLYTARLAGLVCCLAVAFFAIRLLPFGKWGAVGLSLLPVMYLLAASSSNDATTFALCLLFIATVLRIVTLKKFDGQRYLPLCIVLALLLGLCKQPYTLLTLLVFLLPAQLFSSRKRFLLYCLACIGGSLFMSGVWTMFIKSVYIPTDPSANTALQEHYVLTHPVQAFKVITGSMFFNSMSDFIVDDFAGLMHWVGVRIPEFFKMVNDILIALLLLIASPFEKVNKFKSWIRGSILLLGLAGSYAVALLIYVSFEAVRIQQMTGLNSRYFTPFIYLAIPVLGCLQLKTVGQYVSFLRYAKLALISLAVVSIVSVAVRFY